MGWLDDGFDGGFEDPNNTSSNDFNGEEAEDASIGEKPGSRGGGNEGDGIGGAEIP